MHLADDISVFQNVNKFVLDWSLVAQNQLLWANCKLPVASCFTEQWKWEVKWPPKKLLLCSAYDCESGWSSFQETDWRKINSGKNNSATCISEIEFSNSLCPILVTFRFDYILVWCWLLYVYNFLVWPNSWQKFAKLLLHQIFVVIFLLSVRVAEELIVNITTWKAKKSYCLVVKPVLIVKSKGL